MPVKRRPRRLSCAEELELAGLPDTVNGRQKYIARLDQCAQLEKAESGLAPTVGETLQSAPRRGWYWGPQAFGEKLAKMVGQTAHGTYQSSALLQRKGGQAAEGLLREGFAHFGLTEASLAERNSYAARAAIAWALVRRSSQPQAWVADQLNLRNAANVRQLVRRFELQIGKVKNKVIKRRIQYVENC